MQIMNSPLQAQTGRDPGATGQVAEDEQSHGGQDPRYVSGSYLPT